MQHLLQEARYDNDLEYPGMDEWIKIKGGCSLYSPWALVTLTALISLSLGSLGSRGCTTVGLRGVRQDSLANDPIWASNTSSTLVKAKLS